eukprot:CAMPEP_0175066710 /NCGR_PEP_ID=MMETSP0052_2-20121109/16672_1 /TAXON_ID=51329 ORGANISM="Polytomella parva, Strain SAG 63-3" /NCGR_SAMPLE_ID=MMETSP0052_2 /ASSEMBLY_ACC=CAM_ASM_000194 /LENGTH=144 /DNA_ID=CAMNT_0016333467 /DNA_START=43 /DNA_END=474 /DNA_ORIENTATION=+
MAITGRTPPSPYLQEGDGGRGRGGKPEMSQRRRRRRRQWIRKTKIRKTRIRGVAGGRVGLRSIAGKGEGSQRLGAADDPVCDGAGAGARSISNSSGGISNRGGMGGGGAFEKGGRREGREDTGRGLGIRVFLPIYVFLLPLSLS